MKICLVGPGIMPIPPSGWGAVEILIWDYYTYLKKEHEVVIVNDPNREEIIRKVNAGNYDVIHIHYDVFCDIIPKLNSKVKILTSHYPYIDKNNHHKKDGYNRIVDFCVKNKGFWIFTLAKKDLAAFVRFGVSKDRLMMMENGINSKLFRVTLEPKFPNRCICLGKIEPRKCQYMLKDVPEVYFAGPLHDNRLKNNPRLLGPWTRKQVQNDLTEYGSLILMSEGESDPLVVKEALMSGLNVIVSKNVANSLTIKKDYIHVIEGNISDIIFNVHQKREEIRKDAVDNYDMDPYVKIYVKNLLKILSI